LKYQLGLFYHLIAGDLSPQHGAAKGFEEHIAFLQQHFKQCIKHYKVYFKQASSEDYIFQYFMEYAFINLSGIPSLEDFLPDKEPGQLENLITLSLPHIPVDRKDVTAALYKKSKKELQLDITTQIDFTQLRQEEARYHYYHTLVYFEVERIKKAFTYQSFQLQNQKQIKLYIQNHQLSLERLAQSLLNQLEETEQLQLYTISKEFTLADIYKTIYIQLERVQQHIETHFTKYLDINGTVSHRSRILSSIDINSKLTFIYSHLMEGGIDSKLFKIIDKPLQKLARITGKENFTYKDLIYYKLLLQEIYGSIIHDTSRLSNELLMEVLYKLNYNSIDFFHYITAGIEKIVGSKETYEEKKQLLYHYRKIYRQWPVKTNVIFQSSLMPLKIQVLTWLKEEIYYLNKINGSKNPEIIKEEPSRELNKISTRLSVAQLAYFVRVMYEIGLISVKSQWDIFRFLQENFSSKKTELISTQSLNNKYYNVEDSTKRAIKDVLIKMLNYINKSK
jgi:hypothetical protein